MPVGSNIAFPYSAAYARKASTIRVAAAFNRHRARLESLAALFDVPSPAAAQLLLKHPALAAIPPNVTITRAKQLSLALRCSMARAGELIAKVRGTVGNVEWVEGWDKFAQSIVEGWDICLEGESFAQGFHPELQA
jgi:hypothetical protein